MTTAPEDDRAPESRAARLAPLAVLALHLGLVRAFESPEAILSGRPLALVDYETHFEQTKRAVEAFERHGKMWAYDPHLLAGSLAGAIFDADNKLHELFTIALHALGVPIAVGFNLFVVLAHVLVVPVVLASARLFGMRSLGASAAALLVSLVWFFDAVSHWAFWAGMISWSFAAYASLLAIALFERWTTRPRAVVLAGVGALLALLHALHPYAFFVLAPPMLASYARRARVLRAREHLAAFATAALVVAANSWWLATAARFWHYLLRSDYFLAATLDFAVSDWLELPRGMLGPVVPHTAFRFFTIVLGAAALARLRRTRDPRFAVLATASLSMLAATYLGGHFAPLRQVQPYRFVLPATFAFALSAGTFVDALPTIARRSPLPRPWAALGVALLAPALASCAHDVIHWLPEILRWVPGAAEASLAIEAGRGEVGSHRVPPAFERRHVPIPIEATALDAFVREHDDGRSRWLVESWTLGEHLAGATDAQILGGFRELNLAHSDANFFRRYPDAGASDPALLPRYLEDYAVGWVVLTKPIPALETRSELLEPVANVLGNRVYKSRIPPALVAGDVDARVEATIDRISVAGSSGGDLVLRYHFLETLACRPGCTVERSPVEGDRVGFLAVRGAPPDFEIWNTRRVVRAKR